jgi:hypothetical protein
MKGTAQHPDDFANAFEAAFARFQVVVEEAYLSRVEWPDRIVAAIGAVIEFAATDPPAANLLINEALAHSDDGFGRYTRVISYIVGLLAPGRNESPHGAQLPQILERSLAGGVAALVGQRVDTGRAGELPALVPEAIQFVLTPYLGARKARRIATSYIN